MIMTITINVGNEENVADKQINVVYDKCRGWVESKNITINLAGELNFTGKIPPKYVTEQVDKYIGVIRDFIIEGLTGCYVEYDENGKEIFIPKELK